MVESLDAVTRDGSYIKLYWKCNLLLVLPEQLLMVLVNDVRLKFPTLNFSISHGRKQWLENCNCSVGVQGNFLAIGFYLLTSIKMNSSRVVPKAWFLSFVLFKILFYPPYNVNNCVKEEVKNMDMVFILHICSGFPGRSFTFSLVYFIFCSKYLFIQHSSFFCYFNASMDEISILRILL